MACPAASKGRSEESARMVSVAFYVARVTSPGRMASFSLDEIYKFETPTTKTSPALNNDLKFFLLHTHHITIDPTVKPIINPQRNVRNEA